MIDVFPRYARFSGRIIAPRSLLRPRSLILAPPPPPPAPVFRKQYPVVVAPKPGDLVQLILQGVGGVPSFFTRWENFCFPGDGPTIVFLETTTSYTLPLFPALYRWIRVKDNLGLASTVNPLTIFGPIDGSTSVAITQHFSFYDFVWNGISWSKFSP